MRELLAQTILVICKVLHVASIVLAEVCFELVQICAGLLCLRVTFLKEIFSPLEPCLLVPYKPLVGSLGIFFVLGLAFKVQFIDFVNVV